MDWAASEWKQNLPPFAIQKINGLEEQVVRFQKERQQKQFQIESLEQNLDIQKRKVEDEKTQKSHLLREQQSLAEACGALEQRVQKLTQEVQTKDNRVNCLEGQLAQAKRQLDVGNSKVTELEKTVAELQHQPSYQPDANVYSSEGIASFQVSQLELQIREKEELIKELTEKLKSKNEEEPLSTFKEYGGSIQRKACTYEVRNQHIQFGKDAPQTSLWDTLGTPLRSSEKRGMNRRHDPVEKSKVDGDLASERIYSLEQKLKQITQELECQRHNSEAAKQALEQKFKEKESSYKQDIKQQAQALSDLDKEFNEIRTKLQQELTQALKTLDANAFQLDKVQNQKQEQEKELAKLHNNVRDLESQCLSKEKVADELKNSMQNLDEMKCSLTSRLEQQECKSKDLQQQLTKTENKLSQLETEAERLKYELDDKKQQIQELQGKISLLTQQHNSAIQEFRTKSSSLEKENQQLTRNIAENKTVIEDKENKIHNYHQQCDGLQNKISSLQQSLDAKEKNIVHLEKEVKDSTTRIAEKDRNLMAINDELNKTKILLQQQNEKCTQYNNELIQNRKELDSKNKQISQLDSNLHSKTEKIILLEEQMKENQDSSNKKEKLILSQESDLKACKQSIKHIETKLQENEKNLKEKDDQNYQLKFELNTISAELKTKISSLEKDLNDNKEQIVIKENQIVTLTANLKEKSNLLNDSENRLKLTKNQLKEVEDKLSNALEINVENETKKKQAERMLHEKILQLEELQKANSIEIVQKEAEIKKLVDDLKIKNNDISSLELKLKTTSEEKIQIASVIDQLENKLKEKEQELLKYEDSTSQLIIAREQVCTLSDKLNAETENLKKCQSNITILEKTLVQTKINLEETIKDKEDGIEKIMRLENMIDEKEKKLVYMENELSIISNNLKTQKLTIEQSEICIAEKEAELEKNRQQLADFIQQEKLHLNKLSEIEAALKIKDEKMKQEFFKYKDNEQQLTNAREQISILNTKLAIQDDSLLQCQLEIKKLEECLLQNKVDLEDLSKIYKSKVERIEFLENVVNEKEQEIAVMEKKLAETSDNVASRLAIEELEALIVEKEMQLKEYEEKICDISKHQEMNSNKVSELETALKAKQEEKEKESFNYKNNEQELINKRKEVDILTAKLCSEEEIIQKCHFEIDNLQETLTQARTNLEESIKDGKCKDDDIKCLECIIGEKEKEVIQMKSKFNTMSDELEAHKNTNRQYEMVIADQKMELEQYEKQVKDMSLLQEENLKKVNDLQIAFREKDKLIEQEIQKYDDCEQKLLKAGEEIDILNRELASNKEELRKCHLEINMLQETLTQGKINFEDISKDNEFKFEKIISLENIIDANEKKISQLQNEQISLSQNLEAQNIVIKQSEIIIADKEMQLEQYKKQVSDISKCQELALNKLVVLETDIKTKDEEIVHLENQVKLANEEIKVLKENTDGYLEEILKLKELDDISKCAIEENECQIATREQTITTLNQNIDKYNMKFKEYQETEKRTQSIIKIKNDQHIAMQMKLTNMTDQLNLKDNQCKRLESLVDKLEKTAATYETEISNLHSEISMLKKDSAKLQLTLSGQNQHLVEMKKEANNYSEKSKILTFINRDTSLAISEHSLIEGTKISQLEHELHQSEQMKDCLVTLLKILTGKAQNLFQTCYDIDILNKNPTFDDSINKALSDLMKRSKGNTIDEEISKEFNLLITFMEIKERELLQLQDALSGATWLLTLKECLLTDSKENIAKLEKTITENKNRYEELSNTLREEKIKVKQLEKHHSDAIMEDEKKKVLNKDFQIEQLKEQLHAANWSMEIKDGRLNKLKNEVISLEKCLQEYENKNNVLQKELQSLAQKKEKLDQPPVNAATHLDESSYFNVNSNEKLEQLEYNLNNAKWLATMKECLISEQRDEIDELKRTCKKQNDQLHSVMEEKAEISKRLDNYIREIKYKPKNFQKSTHVIEFVDEDNKSKKLKFTDTYNDQKLDEENEEMTYKNSKHKSVNTKVYMDESISPKVTRSIKECEINKDDELALITERFHQQNKALKQLEDDLNNVKWLLTIKECMLKEQGDDINNLKRIYEEQNKQLISAIKDKPQPSNKLVKHDDQTKETIPQNLSCNHGCFFGDIKPKRVTLLDDSFMNIDAENALSCANWSLIMNECMLSDLKHEIFFLHTTLEEERYKNVSLLQKLSEKGKSFEQYIQLFNIAQTNNVRNDIYHVQNEDFGKLLTFPIRTKIESQCKSNILNSIEKRNYSLHYHQADEHSILKEEILIKIDSLSEILISIAANKSKLENKDKCPKSLEEHKERMQEEIKKDYCQYKNAFRIIEEVNKLLNKVITKTAQQKVMNGIEFPMFQSQQKDNSKANLGNEMEDTILPVIEKQLSAIKQTKMMEEEVQLNLIEIEKLQANIINKKIELADLERRMNITKTEMKDECIMEENLKLTLEDAILNQDIATIVQEIKNCKFAALHELCEEITTLKRFQELIREKNNELGQVNEVIKQNSETNDLNNSRYKSVEDLLEKANQQLNSKTDNSLSERKYLTEQNSELQKLCTNLTKQIQCSACKISELEDTINNFSKQNQMNEELAARCRLLENEKKEHHKIYELLKDLETKMLEYSKDDFSFVDNSIATDCNVQFVGNQEYNDKMIIETAENFQEKLKQIDTLIQEIIHKFSCQSSERELIQLLKTEKAVLTENLSELHEKLATVSCQRDDFATELQIFKEGIKQYQVVISELKTSLELEENIYRQDEIKLEKKEIPAEIYCHITNALNLISDLRNQKVTLCSKVKQQQTAIMHLEKTIRENQNREKMLESKIEQYQSTIMHLNETVKETKHENMALCSEIEQIHSTVIELKATVDEIRTREIALTSQVEQKQHAIMQLNQSLEEYKSKNMTLNSQAEQQQNTIMQLNETIEEIEENLQKLFEEKTECLEKIQILQNERDQLSTQCFDLQNKIENLSEFYTKNSKLEELNNELHIENQRLKITSEQLRAQLTMLQDEAEKRLENEESILELETKLIELQIKMEETESELNSANENYTMECNNVKGLKEKIASLLFTEEKLSKELQILKNKYQDLERENASLSQDLTERMTALQKAQNHSEGVEKNLISLKAEIAQNQEDFSLQLNGYCTKVNCLTNQLQAFEADLIAVRQERDILLKEHEENEIELEKSWKKLKDTEEALAAKDRELKICQNKLDISLVEYGWNKQAWEENSSSLKKQLMSAESKVENLKKDLDTAKKKILEQETELQLKNQDLKQYQSDLQDKVDKVITLDKQLNQANSKIKEIEENFSFCQLKLNAQIKTTEKEQSLIVQLKNRIKCANDKLEKEKCKLQEQVSKKKIAEEAVKTAKHENEKMLKDITTLQATCEEKDKQIKLLQEEKKQKLENQNEMLQLESKLKQMEKEKELLAYQLCQKTTDNETLDGLYKTLQMNCQQLEEEVCDLKAKSHSETNSPLQQSAANYKHLEEEYRKLNEQLCQTLTHNKSLEELCKSLQASHEQLVKELSDLENKHNAIQHSESRLKYLEKKCESLTEQLQQKTESHRLADELYKSLQIKYQKLEKEFHSLKNKPYSDENAIQGLREQLKEKTKQMEENESELAEVWVKYADSLQEGNSLREKCKYLKMKLQSYEEELQQMEQKRQAEKILIKESTATVNVEEKSSDFPQETCQTSDRVKRTDLTIASAVPISTLEGDKESMPNLNRGSTYLPSTKVKSRDFPSINPKRVQAQPSNGKRMCKENKPFVPSRYHGVNTKSITRTVLTAVTDNTHSKNEGKSSNEHNCESEIQQKLRKKDTAVPRSGVKIASSHLSQETVSSSDKSDDSKTVPPTPLTLCNISSKTQPSPLSCANQKKVLPSADDCKLQ